MIKSRPSPYASIFLAITMFIILPAPSPAQVRVLMSGGFSAAYQELLPEFQKTTGITVTTARGPSQGDGPNTIGAQLRRGVPADMVIMSRNGLAELFGEGKIVMGSDVDLAEVPLGIGVRVGAPRPDISTVDAFKQTLLRAKSVGTQSSSTIYMTTKLFPQLGIASAMAGYIVERWAGTFVHQSFPSLRCPYGGLVFVQLKPVDMFRNRNGLIDDGPLLESTPAQVISSDVVTPFVMKHPILGDNAHVPIDVFSASTFYPLVNFRLDQPLHLFRILGLYGAIAGNYASHQDQAL